MIEDTTIRIRTFAYIYCLQLNSMAMLAVLACLFFSYVDGASQFRISEIFRKTEIRGDSGVNKVPCHYSHVDFGELPTSFKSLGPYKFVCDVWICALCDALRQILMRILLSSCCSR
jgi:hypothetical protein